MCTPGHEDVCVWDGRVILNPKLVNGCMYKYADEPLQFCSIWLIQWAVHFLQLALTFTLRSLTEYGISVFLLVVNTHAHASYSVHEWSRQ